MKDMLTFTGRVDKEPIGLYTAIMIEVEGYKPSAEELDKSQLYFIELQDALTHYSYPELKGFLHTLTVRSGQDGNPHVEFVSETRFPVLDDMPDHLKRLHFVAERLDRLPAEFWESNDYYLGGQAPEDFPHVPMQVLLWGRENNPNRRMELQKHFKQYGWDIKGAFTRNAHGYEASLRDFSWSNENDLGGCRDDAEQSFRMVSAYIQLKDYFEKNGLPEDVTDF